MRAAAWITLLAVVACDRGRSRDPSPASSSPLPGSATSTSAPTAAAASADRPAACTLEALPLRRPAAPRVVAIGDLHGDLASSRRALQLAGAIDGDDRWIGGALVVVQTGDVLDRGDDEQAILDLLFRLERDARLAGGALVFLLGNHELMNAAGDFRYVTPGAMADFDDVAGLDTRPWQDVPEVARKRIAALGPGGVYARLLAAHDVVTIVGDTVYSHAGVVGAWAARIDEANRASRCWLDGQAGGIAAAPAALTADDSPVWTRAYGGDEVDCAALRTTLRTLGAARMVVGHTVQPRITSACDGALWRIDVGLARNYGGPLEVLELVEGAAPKVLSGTR